MIQKIIKYLKDVRSEMIKVSWPSRGELTGASLLVMALSIMMALFSYGCDQLFRFLLSFFLRIG
jgi:preprotein translocase subunit SecE